MTTTTTTRQIRKIERMLVSNPLKTAIIGVLFDAGGLSYPFGGSGTNALVRLTYSA